VRRRTNEAQRAGEDDVSIAWIALVVVTALVAALHLLRLPARRVDLPSTLLWARALAHAPRLRAPWRRRLALVLALAIAWSLLFALPLPGGPFAGGANTRVALVLDTSPSMVARTRDGRSRFEHARERAGRVIDALPGSAEVALLDTTASSMPTGFVTPREARAALARLQPGNGQASIPPLPDDAQTHLFTDGVAFGPSAATATIHSVYEPADNVAVTAFDVRNLPQQPTRVDALVQVLNASPGSRRVQLIVRGSDGFHVAQAIDLAGGERVDVTIDVSSYRGSVLAAAAALASDAYAADDIAYAAVPAHRALRVLLVSDGNPGLRDALRSLPAIALSVRAPVQFDAARADPAAGFDAYVFDRVAPASAPPGPALLLRPPPAAWLGGAPEGASVLTQAAGLLRVAAMHPAVEGLRWGSAPVQALRTLRAAEGQSVLLHARGGEPAALAFETPVRGVLTAFAWNDAPLSLQAQLPVFLGNALRWLTGGGDMLRAPPGTIAVPLPDARVTDGSGARVASRSVGSTTVFDAHHPDVFTVRAGARSVQVTVQPPAPARALINDSALNADTPKTTIAAAGRSLPGAWLMLALLAAVLLAIDWLLVVRRVTG